MKVIKHKDKWYLQSETGYKEILLSTDIELQKDGVQAIDDEFLEWFVKNPSCEYVEVYKDKRLEIEQDFHFYKIIIPKEDFDYYHYKETFESRQYYTPKEEPKQETLEEAAERWVFDTNGHKWSNNDDTAGDNYNSFIKGTKWQMERSYSEEDMKSFGDWCRNGLLNTEYSVDRLNEHLEQWKQLKNK